MPILNIIARSFKETFKPKRLLPFFLLYFLFSICFLIFFMPILSISPFLLTLKYTSQQLALVSVNFAALFIIFILIFLLSLWFMGALIFDVWTGKGFELGLNYSKKLYWQILALSIILIIIAGILSFLDIFGIILQVFVTWFFIFALPSIIVKKDSFELALMRSFSIVRKNLLRTFTFFLFISFISSVLLFSSVFLAIAAASPLISSLSYMLKVISTSSQYLSQAELVQLVGLLMNSYPIFFVVGIIVSLFFAFSHVFVLTTETYYFIELTKKKLIYF